MTELVIRSGLLPVPHAFLDAAQSEGERYDLAGDGAGPVIIGPVLAKQVHSALALAVDRPFTGEPPEADALVTATPGLMLGIVTADCAPVLLADPQAGVIGAVHAGWRGAHGGVLEAAVAQMCALGARAERIVAAIGPCIAQRSYEVDQVFRERFPADADCFFAPGREGHFQFDLEAYAAARLEAAGVAQVDAMGIDTYAHDDRLFSYRRATHRGEPTTGRQLSLIVLPPGA